MQYHSANPYGDLGPASLNEKTNAQGQELFASPCAFFRRLLQSDQKSPELQKTLCQKPPLALCLRSE
jgi:hypothetical protein